MLVCIYAIKYLCKFERLLKMIDIMIAREEAKKFPWALLAIRPANGKWTEFNGLGFRGAHFPATATAREKIVIIKGDKKFTKKKIGTKYTEVSITDV